MNDPDDGGIWLVLKTIVASILVGVPLLLIGLYLWGAPLCYGEPDKCITQRQAVP